MDFSQIFNSLDVNISCHLLNTTLTNACHYFIPTIKIRSNSSPKWFNAEIRHHFNQIHSVRRLVRKNPTISRITKLHNLETFIEKLICSSKESYILGLIASFSSDPKKLYRYLRDLTKTSTSDVFLDKDSEIITDPLKIAEAFNDFFHSTFTRSEFVLPSIDELPTPSSQLSSIDIDISDTFEALAKLNSDKAMGCDNISPKVLKTCTTSLSEPVTALFGKCLSTCSMPDVWKIHKITPIPKKGNLSLISNYRPISLLCILAKVLENIVVTKIIDFVRPLLSNHQYGFLSKRSGTSQLLACYYQIIKSFENRKPADVLYLDLRKAFDSVPHNELLFKLWRMGITGPLWFWFRAYLTDRHHFVHYKGNSSTTLPVISGVPQGSVLGPLLFLIYINDITASISYSSIYLFADDAKVVKSLVSSINDHSQLQDDLDTFDHWSTEWKICLNALKCSHMHFSLSGKEQTTKYQVNDTVIKYSSSYKDLGILVNGSLSWSAHINQICSKAYRSFHIIKRNIPPISSINLRKQLYLSLVRSHLTYCSQLWRPHLFKDIKNLEKVQRRASKFILHDYSSNYRTRLLSLNLLPLSYWLELQDILFLVKSLQNPQDNFNILDYIHFTTNHTRASTTKKLSYRFQRTTIGRHYYFNRIIRLWNFLPEINLLKSFETIKFNLTKVFWNYFVRNFDSANLCTFNLCCPCQSCHLSQS